MSEDERVTAIKHEEEGSTILAVELDENRAPPKAAAHVAFYIGLFISLSSAIILFNKYILTHTGFNFPILLTSWHMIFSTIMTRVLARYTSMLDSRKTIPMTTRRYVRTILPIGVLFSLCLMLGNMAYVYLTVSFIQMLKASTPVVTILASWTMGKTPLSFPTLGNATVIVLGVIIASYGDVHFVILGVLIQLSSVVFDAMRLVLMQHVLTTSMDSLVLLYYLSPLCAVINILIACFGEIQRITLADVHAVGYFTLVANASVAFALNVSTVVLISKTTSLAMTLCGVLKNILIVVASMLFFSDTVSGLQALGYSIATCGLVYYQLGGDQTNMNRVREFVDNKIYATRELRRRSPKRYWAAVFIAAMFALVCFIGTLSMTGTIPAHYDPAKLVTGRVPGTTIETNRG